MGPRRIQAHEEERAGFARELHDDINQRIAVVSLKLDGWLQDHPKFGMSDGGKLQKVCSQHRDGRTYRPFLTVCIPQNLTILGLPRLPRAFAKNIQNSRMWKLISRSPMFLVACRKRFRFAYFECCKRHSRMR